MCGFPTHHGLVQYRSTASDLYVAEAVRGIELPQKFGRSSYDHNVSSRQYTLHPALVCLQVALNLHSRIFATLIYNIQQLMVDKGMLLFTDEL